MGAKKKYKAHISKYVRHILKYLRPIFCPLKTILKNASKMQTKNYAPLPYAPRMSLNAGCRAQKCSRFKTKSLCVPLFPDKSLFLQNAPCKRLIRV